MEYVTLCAPAEYMVCDDILYQSGTYVVGCTGWLGCDSIRNLTLTILDPIAAIAPPEVLDCNGSSITLNSTGSNLNTASNGVTQFRWTGPGIVGPSNTATAEVNLPGEYCLILQHSLGGVFCADTICVTVQSTGGPPGATATGGNIFCASPQTTLMGNSPTSGVNYSWAGPGINPGNMSLQNPTVNMIGLYLLTVTNPANGCTSTASVTVNGDALPSASAVGDTITCLQTSVTINGETDLPAPAWNWAGPGINAGNQHVENPSVVLPGTYTVTVTNTTNGCTNTATAEVVLNDTIPTVTAGPNDTLNCTDPNITLLGDGDGGGQPIAFAWTGPNGFMSNLAQPNVNMAGTYILTVLNTQNGCLNKDTVDIASNQAVPIAQAGADSTITCVQPMVFLIGSGSTIGLNFTATWTGPGINAGNMNLYNPEVDQPGTYNLVILDITNGCTATDQVLVDINTALPTASAGPDQQINCSTPNGVTLSGNGGPSAVAYLWSGPNIDTNNETQQSPTVTHPGTYELMVTSVLNGCTAIAQVIVTQDTIVPDANGGPDHDLNCTVTSVDIDGSGSSSGPGINYLWSGPGISGSNMTTQSPTGLTVPGTYNLVVMNANNHCQSTDMVVIQQDIMPPTADAGNTMTLNCFNNGTDTLDASGSDLDSTFTLLWSGPGINAGNQNSTNPIITNQPGLYVLTVTNTENTCTATDQVNVTTDLVDPIADAGTGQTIDCVILTADIGGNSSSGANFSYLWTGPGINSGNASLATTTISEAGIYTLLVTNTLNGCTATEDVLINTNALPPTALAGNDGLLTCTNPTAILDGSGSSIGPNMTVFWSGPGIHAGNQGQLSPSVTMPGNYILLITNTGTSCTKRDTVEVVENKAIPTADAGPDWILDCLITDTLLDGSLSAVSPTIVYTWAGNGINGSNQNDQSPLINQPGIYNLVVTDHDNGCSDTDQVIVTQDTIRPTASAGADMLITCAMLTTLIDGSGSSVGPHLTYSWEGPGINSGNFPLQNPPVSVSGTYTVMVTNTLNHCTATDVVFVDSDNSPPVIHAGPDQTLSCADVSAQLDATLSAGPNISFLWVGPGIAAGDQTSPTPTVTLPGTYVLTLTNAINGCTSEESVNVGIDTISPLVTAGNDWVINCTNASTGVTLNSAGSSVGPNYVYLWSGQGITATNESLANPTVLLSGTYSLLITNMDNGCSDSDEVFVDSQQELPTANAGPDQVINCSATDATLDGSGSSSSNGNLIFHWSGPGINMGNEDDEMPMVLLSGSYTLTVTNPGTSCSAMDQVEVTLDDMPPTVMTSAEMITCLEPTATLEVTSSLTGSTYLWTGPDIIAGNQTNQSVEVALTGLYSVTVTAPNGCTATASTDVTADVNLPDGLTLGNTLNCLNNSMAEISGQVISPPGATFTWTGPGIVGSAYTPVIEVNQAGTYVFTIIAPNGCVRFFNTEVATDFTAPSVVLAAADQIDCNNTEVILNATSSSSGPAYTFIWTTTNGHFLSGTNTLTPHVDRAGQYQLFIYNTLNGCSNSNQVDVLVDPLAPSGFNLAVNNIKCFGETNGSFVLNGVEGGTSPFIFFLTDGNGSATNQYTGLAAGSYLLSLEDAKGCQLDTIISISEPGQLIVDLGPDITLSLGEYATVTAQIQSDIGIESVDWNYSPGCEVILPTFCTTFSYQPFETYRHRITVVDSNGCVERDEVLVNVKKLHQVYVPNIFNPNSSENNYVTVFAGIDVSRVNSFFIFDRWGDKVFEAIDFLPNDVTRAWDGIVKGHKAQPGVYVWYCEVEFIDGEKKIFKGDVTLVR
jgi:hypothetical protein